MNSVKSKLWIKGETKGQKTAHYGINRSSAARIGYRPAAPETYFPYQVTNA